MAGANDDGDDRNNRRIASQSTDVPGKRGNEDASSLVEVPCSICLELVVDDGTRSMAKLQCGHQFHLDCIGSAFNMKGTMQCPNCRNVEKGQWLFANGSTRLFPEFVMEDWIPEEDLYALSYPEMQYRVHWCPFGELSQAGSFEELEPSATTYHNEFHGHHAVAMNHSYPAYVNGAMFEVFEGDARSILCDVVDKHHASLLVVGSHGYGAIKRAVLGSVSDYCAHHAHCSVMIVKKPKIKH
ncbi:hypothetical protein F2Q68_00023648 [Brassica cretica]|uniref:RING-type domain-containing protein n=1 Tax=Brassica cretica TaxID=69181 RepID=A0A8S9ICL2_BRACR|nr:hypothetical protein F2Q68_00023648 [Brassica cretica]